MGGEIDGIGEAVTGAMLAGAVEPAGAEGDGDHTNERNCLNCGQLLSGKFCAACGQKAHAPRTLGAFVHDLIHGVLHVDGKAWRTLGLLAWHPGQLTRRYVDGQRARFVSPMALFLFSVFVMFAVLGATVSTDNISSPRVTGDIAKAETDTRRELAELEEKRKQPLGPGESYADIDEQIVEARSELASLETMKKISANQMPNLRMSAEIGWLEEPIRHAMENPDLLLYKVRTSAYKWSWVVIPLSVPFLWLLFPLSRRFAVYDHVVFVTYSLSFMSLLAVVTALLFIAGVPAIAGFMFFIPPFHFYRQLKEAYGLTTLGALWRAAALTIFAIIALVLFALMMLTVGVL